MATALRRVRLTSGVLGLAMAAALGAALAVVALSACNNRSVAIKSAAATDSPSAPTVTCDKAGAQTALSKMTDPRMAQITEEDGWVVVRFGTDYGDWSPEMRDVIITSYANVDACISGKARSMEFRSPSGKVIARVDRLRGIKVY